MKKAGYIILILFAFWSCQKTDEDTFDAGYNYFPIQTGYYTIFKVQEYTYDDFTSTIDTNIYLLKEKFDSSFTDGEGRNAYLLKRYTKADVDSITDWKLVDVWTAYKGKDQAERFEENVTFIKLIFPLKRNKSWDGNAKNDSLSQIYKVLDYDLKEAYGGKTFMQTCRINQYENKNLIEDELSEEVYARDFGLVFKVMRKLSLNPADSSIVKGYDYTWTYKESGLE